MGIVTHAQLQLLGPDLLGFLEVFVSVSSLAVIRFGIFAHAFLQTHFLSHHLSRPFFKESHYRVLGHSCWCWSQSLLKVLSFGGSPYCLCLGLSPCVSQWLACSLFPHCTLPFSIWPFPTSPRLPVRVPVCTSSCLFESRKYISYNRFNGFDWYSLIYDSSGFAAVD